jgi:DNA polymerase-3 subunit gamma/tau
MCQALDEYITSTEAGAVCPGITEVDAATTTGKSDINDIIEDALIPPMWPLTYKVLILDECHMLSTGAWNAMLKLLEEPPAQTIFIMCTTDPQKIPATILSRVQRYDFQRITHKAVVDRLRYILMREEQDILENGGPDGVYSDSIQEEALEYIAKLADGGMRDAITLLDKCLSYSNEVTIKNVVEALGTIDYTTMINLTNAILHMKADDAVVIIEEAHRSGVDLKQFTKQYSHFLLDVYKYSLLGGFEYLQIPSSLASDLKGWSEDDFLFIRDLLDVVIKLNVDIKWETSPKPLIEATFILACQENAQ